MIAGTDSPPRRATDMATHLLAPVLHHIRAVATPAAGQPDAPLVARFARRGEVPAVDVAAAPASDCPDLRPVLDDVIARLPARDRTPVVLCYFQGLTYAEAARRLRCPPGTVSARLARARARLRVLLTRRGIVPAAGAVAAVLAPESLAATVPAALRQSTIQVAVGTAIPAGVLTLTKGVGQAMILDNVKLLAAVALLGTAGTGAWVYGPAIAQVPADRPAPP